MNHLSAWKHRYEKAEAEAQRGRSWFYYFKDERLTLLTKGIDPDTYSVMSVCVTLQVSLGEKVKPVINREFIEWHLLGYIDTSFGYIDTCSDPTNLSTHREFTPCCRLRTDFAASCIKTDSVWAMPPHADDGLKDIYTPRSKCSNGVGWDLTCFIITHLPQYHSPASFACFIITHLPQYHSPTCLSIIHLPQQNPPTMLDPEAANMKTKAKTSDSLLLKI